MNKQQMEAAKQALTAWLSHPQLLGKAPAKVKCTAELEAHGLRYYVFQFKETLFGPWKLGVSGGFEGDTPSPRARVLSRLQPYCADTALTDAAALVEELYQSAELNRRIQANLDRNQAEELPADRIQGQFVQSERRDFLTVGEVDCPTGRIVAADPLAYLASDQPPLVLPEAIPAGTYPVSVSICKSPEMGLRMCTARLTVKDTPAVRYRKATEEGFPVDAGMMCFCDEAVAEECHTFFDQWEQAHPDCNLYDDYFAPLLAASYEALPDYQAEEGDLLEWANPRTGHKLVMVASGLGDGVYCCYYGYDAAGELCEIIVPMVDPELFDC